MSTKKTTGDLALVKKINTAIVLESILKERYLSRAQISERTGLNKATVSSLVQELVDRHLVQEVGTGQSSGGRKPVMLLFNADAGYAIGIDIGVNYIRGVLADLEGNVITEQEIALPSSESEVVLKELEEQISQLIAAAPKSPYGIVGIGIGMAGIVDGNGVVQSAPNMKNWKGFDLKGNLEHTFKLPVTVDNEANVGAQGERIYGSGIDVNHLIYVSVGIGIGTGLILDKELYKGSLGFSGELGHLSIEFNGHECSCGNKGCWELYASENALLAQAKTLGFTSLKELLKAAEAGNQAVQELFASIGSFLGIGIANIINIFNPEAVVIGNRMSRARQWLEPTLIEAASSRSLAFHNRQSVNILFAELQDQSAVRGAAFNAIKYFLSK